MQTVKEISAKEAQELLQEQEEKSVLIDVRDVSELEICKIPGSSNIPLGEIEKRIEELDKGKTIVLCCHHGRRSFIAGQILCAHGFNAVYSVRGGIDAWAQEIDPSMKRY